MAGFDTYKDAFPHAKLSRSQEGVLEAAMCRVLVSKRGELNDRPIVSKQ